MQRSVKNAYGKIETDDVLFNCTCITFYKLSAQEPSMPRLSTQSFFQSSKSMPLTTVVGAEEEAEGR